MQEAFKDMAKVLRWRVLANRHHSIREADLILGGESLMKLLTLIWESRRPMTVFVCTTWVSDPRNMVVDQLLRRKLAPGPKALPLIHGC